MMSGSSTLSSTTMDAPANNMPTLPAASTSLDHSSPQEQENGNSVIFSENLENDDFEVDSFLLTALSNPRDRLTLLKLDTDLEKFIKDPRKTRQEFPPMSSYQRLIVHRVAQYFKLDHVVVEAEPGKRAVVLYKTPASRVPIIRLVDLVEQPEVTNNNTKAVKIMRRSNSNTNNNERSVPSKPIVIEESTNKALPPSNPTKEDIRGILQNPSLLPSQPDSNSNNNQDGKSLDKSLEEREVNYAKARARIFGVSEDATTTPEQPTSPTLSSEPSKDTSPPAPSATVSSGSTNGTSYRKPRNTVHTKYNEPLQDAHEYSRNVDDWRSNNGMAANYMWGQPIPAVSPMSVPAVPAVPMNYFDIQSQMNGSYQRAPPTGYPVAPHPTWDEFSNAYRIAYPSTYYPPVVSPHHFPPLSHPTQYQQQPIRKSPQTTHKPTTDNRPPSKASQYYAPVQNPKKAPTQQFIPPYTTTTFNPKPDSIPNDQTSPVMAHKVPTNTTPPSSSVPSQPFVPRGYPQTYEDMWGYSSSGVPVRPYPNQTYSPLETSNQDRKQPKKEPTTGTVQFQQNTPFRTSSPAIATQPKVPSIEPLESEDDTSSHVPRSPSHDSFFSLPSSANPSPSTNQPMYNNPPTPNSNTLQESPQVKTGPTLLSHILEVGNMKMSMMNTPSAESFLEELKQLGGIIKCLDNGTILVVFKSVGVATRAVQSIQQTSFFLKPWKVNVTNVVIGESNSVPNPADTLITSLENLNIS